MGGFKLLENNWIANEGHNFKEKVLRICGKMTFKLFSG